MLYASDNFLEHLITTDIFSLPNHQTNMHVLSLIAVYIVLFTLNVFATPQKSYLPAKLIHNSCGDIQAKLKNQTRVLFW